MRALLRLLSAVVYLTGSTAMFIPAVQLLPAEGVRYRSPGLLGLLATFLAVGAVRHLGFAGQGLPTVAFSFVVCLTILVGLAGSRAFVVAIWLAAWIGVDLFCIGLAIAGLDISTTWFTRMTFVWESGAALYAITRYAKLNTRSL